MICDRTDLEVSEFSLTHSVEIMSIAERNVENVFFSVQLLVHLSTPMAKHHRNNFICP